MAFDGKSLKINARARKNGVVRVAVCDSNGDTIPGFGLEDCVVFGGDSVRHEVRWSGGATLPPPESSRFRKLVVALDEAEIFGFVVE